MMMMMMMALIHCVHSGKSIREPIPMAAMAYGRLSDHQTHKYCHHRAACGTRAQPGPLISTNDPTSAQDGFQCACFGKDSLGSVTSSCYRGVCDYGTFFLSL